MPSSYTPSLRLTLPVTGELAGTWGDTVNTGITNLVDASVAGTAAVTMTDADYTLTSVNGATDEARKMFVTLTGTLTAARNVICPTASKLYFIKNTTTGGYAVTLKTSAGTGISVPNGKSMVLYCDATNVVDATNHYSSITIATALAATSGGTGQASYTTGDLLYASSSTALSKLGVGTAGQVLTSSGTAPQWSTLSGVAVTTFSAGTTGFTPSTATSGAITLAGTLATTNGGTGLTSFTSGGVVYASSTSALATVTALNFDGTTLSSVGAGDRVRFGTGSRNIYIAGDSGGVSLFDGAGQTGNGWYISGASSYVAGYIGSSEQMRLTSVGLGVGTSSPTQKLEVVGNIQQQNANYLSGKLAAGTVTRLFGLNASDSLYIGSIDANHTGGTFFVKNGTIQMIIDSSGRVGIGTNSPGSKLEVTGTTKIGEGVASNTAKLMVNTISGVAAGIQLFQDGNESWIIQNPISSTALTFGNSGVERMRLDSLGNLGIGTSSPSYKLDVQDATGASARIRTTSTGNATLLLDTAAGGVSAVDLQTAAGLNRIIGGNGGTSNLGFYTASTLRATINDSGNLGIGTSSPAVKLDVNGVGGPLSAVNPPLQVWDTTALAANVGGGIAFGGNYTGSTKTNWAGIAGLKDNATDGQYGGYLAFYTRTHGVVNAERMRIDSSGNVGIGTGSPSSGSIPNGAGSATTPRLAVATSSGVAASSVAVLDGTVNYRMGLFVDNTNSLSGISSTYSTGAVFPFVYRDAVAERLRIDASGNLGLGVVPSAWGSGISAFEFGSYGAITGQASNVTQFINNAYVNSSSAWTYKGSSTAAMFRLNGAEAQWFNAPSGTGGTAITWTQAMTLDASGNLLVGRTSTFSDAKLIAEGASTSFISRLRNTSATTPSGLFVSYTAAAPNGTGDLFLRCDDSAATRAEIRSNGGIGNFSANDVNLSDVRTKKDIQDAPSYLNRICAIPVRTFLYKDQTDEQLNLGVIAQEVEAQCPELVDNSGFGTLPEDGVPLKAIYQTDLQYALMKCIQEQQTLIESLTARIVALESKP